MARAKKSESDPCTSARNTAADPERPIAWCMTRTRPSLPARLAVVLVCTVGTGLVTSAEPGDDFFAYANATWLETTGIPAGSGRWTARDEIVSVTRQQVAQLIRDAAAAPAGSDARKVADFHSAYLNESAIESRGLRSLTPLLARISAVHDKAALTRVLGGELRADVDPLNWGIYDSDHLMGLAVQAGLQGEKTYVVFLLQGGLGLAEREHYFDPAPDRRALRARYQAHIARMLQLAGFDRPVTRAEAVMALETAIARSHATREDSGNERNTENLWSLADFARRAPGMDWTAFFAAAGLSGQQNFVVWQPGAIEGAAELVASQPLAAWQDYLRFHTIHRYAEALPRAFTEQSFLLDRAPPSREQRAIEITQQAMSGALGRLYSARYFPPDRKAHVQAIAGDVIAAFRRRVEAVSWLSPASKTRALAKLDTLYFGVGYPEKWPDYSTLAVSPVDALNNLRRVAEWNYQNARARIGRPIDHTDWWISPQSGGAVLLFQQNAYNFSAALLQPPKYDPSASQAAAYGSIGAIFGHEVSHFADTIGADYDAQGRKLRWWSAEDLANYQAAVEPLVQQYASYQPFPDLAVDGRKTLVENLADLAGLNAAFDAHRRALGTKVNDPAFVRQQDREFFIGFARSWRSKYRDDALRAYVTSDAHAPDKYRIATVRNLDAWYEAFDVQPGHRLYLEPKARVRIW
jgi:putative endopeptidase